MSLCYSALGGFSQKVLDLQPKAIGVPLIKVKTSWENYGGNFKKVVTELKGKGTRQGRTK